MICIGSGNKATEQAVEDQLPRNIAKLTHLLIPDPLNAVYNLWDIVGLLFLLKYKNVRPLRQLCVFGCSDPKENQQK